MASFIENVNRVSAWLQGLPYEGEEASSVVTIDFVSSLPATANLGEMVYMTTTGIAYVWDGTAWRAFGSGGSGGSTGSITKVEALPSVANEGDIVYLNPEDKLYVRTSTGWVEVGSGSSGGGSDTVFVDTRPANPSVGDTVLNILDGSVSRWDGTQWVVEPYTPNASSITAVAIVDALPLTANNGDIVYNSSDGKMYVRLNGVWTPYFESLVGTGVIDSGIEVVTQNPLTVVENKVIYNSTDKKLYQGISGVWTQVVEPTTAATEVADGSITTAKFASNITPVEIVTELPNVGNYVGRVVYLTTDGQLYRYTASGYTTAVPAQALTGTIGSTQIANDAITTPKIATGAITADEIGANAITAGKIAVGAVTAGTISAGAVSATEIAANAITTEKIYAGAITSTKIATNAIDASKIVAGTITADKIASNSITAGHLQSSIITADKIATGIITADKIASKAITAFQIQAGAISSAEIASNAITADKIATNSIIASKIQAGTITGDKLNFNTITADKIVSNSLTQIKDSYWWSVSENVASTNLVTIGAKFVVVYHLVFQFSNIGNSDIKNGSIILLSMTLPWTKYTGSDTIIQHAIVCSNNLVSIPIVVENTSDDALTSHFVFHISKYAPSTWIDQSTPITTHIYSVGIAYAK